MENTMAPVVIDSERRGLPSASAVERYLLCPGAFMLERFCPAPKPSEYAQAGTRIHAASETGDATGLSMSEADILMKLAEIKERLFNQWIAHFKITKHRIFREERVWLKRNQVDIFSAKLDFHAIGENAAGQKLALIIDDKSGRHEESPPASNWQLRGGAVALFSINNLDHARVVIAQPMRKEEPPCDYDKAALFESWMALTHQLDVISQPDAPRTPGFRQCEFCRAKASCPEGQAFVKKVSQLKGLVWGKLPPEKKLELWKTCKLADKISKDIKENTLHDLKKNPEAIPGLIKSEDQTPREITDVTAIYTALHALDGFKPEMFPALVEMTVGKLNEFVQGLTGKSEAEADVWINTACKSAIELGVRSGSVKLDKPEKKGAK